MSGAKRSQNKKATCKKLDVQWKQRTNHQKKKPEKTCFKSAQIFFRDASISNQRFEMGASCTASLSREISRFWVSEMRLHNFWKALSSQVFQGLDVTQYDSGRLNMSFKQDLGRSEQWSSSLIWAQFTSEDYKYSRHSLTSKAICSFHTLKRDFI